MKKLMIVLVCLFALQGLAKADNDRPIEVKELPQKALTFIDKYFADVKVSYSKTRRRPLGKEIRRCNGKRTKTGIRQKRRMAGSGL